MVLLQLLLFKMSFSFFCFRAWVPTNQVFMLSAEPPAPVKNKKGSGFDEAMAELERYVAKHKYEISQVEFKHLICVRVWAVFRLLRFKV